MVSGFCIGCFVRENDQITSKSGCFGPNSDLDTLATKQRIYALVRIQISANL